MKGKKITTGNYFEVIDQIGFENLPQALKESHMAIIAKTNEGEDWSGDADFKSMYNLAFEKLSELLKSEKSLSGTYFESDNHIAVEFIKEFISMADKTIYREDLDKFITKLQSAINSGIINKKSDFAKEINQLQALVISLFNSIDKSVKVKLKPETRKMLHAVISKAEAQEKITKKKAKKSKDGMAGIAESNHEKASSSKHKNENIMCSTDFTNLQFNAIGFTGKWLDFIGDPAPGFTAMVFGMPKMGKSYLCVDFAGYLARNHGKVLYVAKEEKLDATLQKKLKDKDVAHVNLFVADALPKDLSSYDFIFLDSVNKLGLLPKDLDKLKVDNKGKSFIYIFQATKGGKFKGNNEFQHDVDVVIEVPEQGKAVQFGRFNQGGELNIFPETSQDLTSSENVSMLAGVKPNKMNNKKVKVPKWTQPEHLSPKDHADLWYVNNLYEEGKFEAALRFASNLDTAVREEIPAHIWKEIGGKLTKMGEEKLKRDQTKAASKKLKNYDDRSDELNPQFIFSLTATQLLCEAIKGEFDINYLMRKELANRGVDLEGKWVGFPKAQEIHNV